MKTFVRVSILASFFSLSGVSATELAWHQTMPGDIAWSRLTITGTLLVASDNELTHVDPSTGEIIWQRRDLLKLSQFDVRNVGGEPVVVINQRLDARGRQSRLLALDVWSGENLWNSKDLDGYVLGNYALPRRNLLVSAQSLRSAGDDKSGIYLVAYSLDSGDERWRLRVGSTSSLPKHRSERGSIQDFSGHSQPVVTNDAFILTAGELIAVDIASGNELWRFKLRGSRKDIKQAFAQPVLQDNILYAAGEGALHAIDPTNGRQIWKVKIGSGPVPQLEMIDNLIVGRLGGTFSTGKDVVSKGPFGAFAVDTSQGAMRWKWTKARDSITNIRVLPDQGLVMLADKRNLYALDLEARGKGDVVYEQELHFKTKLGPSDVVAKGIKTVGGLLGGTVRLGGDDGRGDPPLDIDIYGDRLIVRAQYHVLAHSISDRTTDWSIQFTPPGIDPLALVAMGAVTAYAVADAARNDHVRWSGQHVLLDKTDASDPVAQKSRNLAFFLTKGEDSLLLTGIDLASGIVVGEIPMAEKDPQFMVDAIGNRVYYFTEEGDLLAFDF